MVKDAMESVCTMISMLCMTENPLLHEKQPVHLYTNPSIVHKEIVSLLPNFQIQLVFD